MTYTSRFSLASHAALAKQTEAFVLDLAANDQFSGAVMVSHEGLVVFQGAWGLASRSFQASNRVVVPQ